MYMYVHVVNIDKKHYLIMFSEADTYFLRTRNTDERNAIDWPGFRSEASMYMKNPMKELEYM